MYAEHAPGGDYWVLASSTCTPLPGNINCVVGPVNLQEDVIVDETGNNFTGNKLAHIVGTVMGQVLCRAA
jgi:hypothetical protein